MSNNNPKKHDVMGNILHGAHSGELPPGVEELTTMLSRYSKPLLRGDISPSRPSNKKAKVKRHHVWKSHSKKKTTHYLSEEVYRDLDMANNYLKELLPSGSKLLANKSKIVDHAVKMLLDDFESKKEKSELVKIIKDK